MICLQQIICNFESGLQLLRSVKKIKIFKYQWTEAFIGVDNNFAAIKLELKACTYKTYCLRKTPLRIIDYGPL